MSAVVAEIVKTCLKTSRGGRKSGDSQQEAVSDLGPAARGSDQPYIIGVSEALTGAVAELANSVYGGLVTYVDWLDKQGGVNGHPLKLEVLDNRLDVPTGVSNN